MKQTVMKPLTRDEYFELEEISKEKHEFFNGEIFAMSGGTFNHAKISGNAFASFSLKLRGKCCQPMNSDMRVETPNGLITYPDAIIFCGEPELTENQCALRNPVVLIEVLSPSARAYDANGKFALYRSIPTFQDYLLIDAEKMFVQHFRKTENNEWVLHDYFESHETIYLSSIQESISLSEIYDNVIFTT